MLMIPLMLWNNNVHPLTFQVPLAAVSTPRPNSKAVDSVPCNTFPILKLLSPHNKHHKTFLKTNWQLSFVKLRNTLLAIIDFLPAKARANFLTASHSASTKLPYRRALPISQNKKYLHTAT